MGNQCKADGRNYQGKYYIKNSGFRADWLDCGRVREVCFLLVILENVGPKLSLRSSQLPLAFGRHVASLPHLKNPTLWAHQSGGPC
jgi:hypothetical protein